MEIFNVLYKGVEKNITPFCLAFLKEEDARSWIESVCDVKSFSIKSTFGWSDDNTWDDYRVEDKDDNTFYFVIIDNN